MTKEDILLALRLTAMGRTGHPLQEKLAERLSSLLASPEQRADAEMAEAGIAKRGRKKAD